MSDSCMSCAMKDIQIKELEKNFNQQRSMFQTILCDLKVDIESDDLDSALETLSSLT